MSALRESQRLSLRPRAVPPCAGARVVRLRPRRGWSWASGGPPPSVAELNGISVVSLGAESAVDGGAAHAGDLDQIGDGGSFLGCVAQDHEQQPVSVGGRVGSVGSSGTRWRT